eukprot:2863671-Pyramimonas_sp.AAC.1
MKMKSLRRHTMRQFAIVSMNKYRGRLQRNILGIEAIVKRELTREIGPPPPWAHSMTAVVDLLFNAEDEYHRHQGNESQMLRDLRELCKVANGSLSNDKFIHHCWDFETSRPCCRSLDESIDKVIIHASRITINPHGPMTVGRFLLRANLFRFFRSLQSSSLLFRAPSLRLLFLLLLLLLLLLLTVLLLMAAPKLRAESWDPGILWSPGWGVLDLEASWTLGASWSVWSLLGPRPLQVQRGGGGKEEGVRGRRKKEHSVHALYGTSDPRPAESRWTNTLINIKRTLLRRLYHKIGLDCFTGTLYASDWDTSNPPDVSIGDEALDDYMKHVFRVRAKKVKEYYESEEMMRELVVFMAILEAADARLLYPMLGDAIRDDGDRSKLDMLLDTDSLIGQFTEDMLGLLNVWDNGDASRRPWMLLDIMKVPMQCQIFSRWARSQILRLSSVMSRRYEVRFSALPYSMYPLSSPRASVAAKRATAERTRALAEHGEMLDCYTRGILRLFPTVNDMLSLKCQMVLNSDFRAHCYGSDQVERLNSEYTARHHVRAPGRNAVNAEREHLLHQLTMVHRRHGGEHPLAVPRRVKDKESLQEVDVLCSPLLACIERPQLQDADAIAEAAPGTPVAMEIDDAPRGDDQIVVFRGVAAEPDYEEERPPEGANYFEEAVVVRKPIDEHQHPGHPGGDPHRVPKNRRGLNPYLLEKNTYMRDAKKAKGSNLTPAEVDAYTKEFKLMWANRDADTYREAYQLWRQNHEGDDQQQPGETDIPKYEQIWGGGEPSTPLTAQEMHGYVSEHGWPSDAEVQDRDMSERRIASDATVTFDSDEVANADPWGTGRSARNIPRAWARVPQAMDIIEKGIFNWFLSLGAERADASDIMLVAEGPLADGGGFQRKVAIVSDVTYNPRVFDVVANSFVQEDLATSEAWSGSE